MGVAWEWWEWPGCGRNGLGRRSGGSGLGICLLVGEKLRGTHALAESV